MAQLIIKGALYFDENIILRPHYSGKFHMVDCDQYMTEEQIRADYSDPEKFINGVSYITHMGIKYYECESSLYHTEKFELLSDLGGLEYFDEETEF